MMTTTAYSTAPLSAGVNLRARRKKRKREKGDGYGMLMAYIEFLSSEAAEASTSLLSIFPTTQTCSTR